MTISKVSPLLCVLAASVACSTVFAEDNAAQAAARMALAKALFDANSQSATNAPAVPPPQPPPAPVAAAPAPVAPAPAPVAPPPAPAAPAPAPVVDNTAPAQPAVVQSQAAPSPATGDNPAQAAAREALAKKLFEAGGSTASAPAPAPTPAPVPAPAPAQPVTAPPVVVQPVTAPPVAAQPVIAPPAAQPVAAQPMTTAQPESGDNQAQAAAREALAKKLFEVSGQPAAPAQPVAAPNTPAPSPVVVDTDALRTGIAPASSSSSSSRSTFSSSTPTGDPSYYVGKELGLKPISAPALPISGTKEQRLAILLDKYKADQITPQEYHQQRAAILSEP